METDLGPVPVDLASQIAHACTHLGGWCPVPKGLLMGALILREKPQTVVEIGVYRGRSLISQALAVKHNGSGIVYAIDPWEPEPTQAGPGLPETETWWKTNDFEADRKEFLAAVDRYGVGPWVEVIRDESAHAATAFEPAPCVDVVHIDGCHSEASALQDVEVWLPKLRPGGWLWIDDSDWSSVRPAYRLAESKCVKIADWDRYSLFRIKPPVS